MSASTSEIDCNEFFICEVCNHEIKSEDKICRIAQWLCPGCAHDADLLEKYTDEQQMQITLYAYEYNLNIAEAIDYQTHCHSCGKYVEQGFDEVNHQYCRKKCFEYCEDYWYPCFREGCCRVCGISQYHQSRKQREKRGIEIEKYTSVLVAIDCFKDLGVHDQILECFGDLVEYY
jgi:hypothetical protein